MAHRTFLKLLICLYATTENVRDHHSFHTGSFINSFDISSSLMRWNNANMSHSFPVISSQSHVEIKRSRWDCKCVLCILHFKKVSLTFWYIITILQRLSYNTIRISQCQAPFTPVHVDTCITMLQWLLLLLLLGPGCWHANTCNCQIRARAVPLINRGLHYGGCH